MVWEEESHWRWHPSQAGIRCPHAHLLCSLLLRLGTMPLHLPRQPHGKKGSKWDWRITAQNDAQEEVVCR